jgi:hypothetical protein
MGDVLAGALRLEWQSVGSAFEETDGKIKFPKLPAMPGLYQFQIFRRDGSQAIYVGESDNLQRRFAHYRNPGPTQQTNLRLNGLFRELLSQQAKIDIEIVTSVDFVERLGDAGRLCSKVGKTVDLNR